LPISVNNLVEPARILVIIGIAYTLAVTGWYFVSTPPAGDAQVQPQRTEALDPRRADVSRIAARNLFGEPGVTQVVAPQVFDAPETRLRLTLEGLFQADDPKRSAAIVAERSQPGELFLVGDRLPGDAVLAEVHRDRIVLRRGAVFETLRFSDEPALARARDMDMPLPDYPEYPDHPEPGFDDPGPAEELAPAEHLDEQAFLTPPGRAQAPVRETVQEYRSRLDRDPEGTLSELGLAPVADGSSAGYRLGALAQHPALRQAGLQSGDVVLSVNGNPIGQIEQDRGEIDRVLAEGAVRLEIQRGGRRFFITTSLQ
jgi:general secretion pathway protein C